MDFDASREALMQPGLSERFFDLGYDAPLDFESSEFQVQAALWLGEFARLIYREDLSENPRMSGPERQSFLGPVGWKELLFLDRGGASCALFQALEGPRKPTVLVFRGTSAPDDWLVNLDALLTSWDKGGSVHKGFKDALGLLWPELEPALKAHGQEGPLYFTGHSLGAALATLAASLFKPFALYTFGSPRVGNDLFVETLHDTPIYRVVNGRDAICQVPLPMPRIGFHHAGRLYYITQAGRLLSDAGQLDVIKDQWKWELSEVGAERRRFFTDLPKFMTDHSPVNYVAQLQRLL
ncbi:MAG: lipase family protein [Planctomycetota bacterium]|nr:lipase family protein [Planctomycetota bacterium]